MIPILTISSGSGLFSLGFGGFDGGSFPLELNIFVYLVQSLDISMHHVKNKVKLHLIDEKCKFLDQIIHLSYYITLYIKIYQVFKL
jgi:hypothetical protein